MPNEPTSLPLLDPISINLDRLKSRLRVVGTEPIDATKSHGRIVAHDISAFRDSPSTDVSAMDGYAIRFSDIISSELPVTGTATAGSVPIQLAAKSAIRVFTGGPVPPQAECIVRREDCLESTAHVKILINPQSISLGQHIRRQGENVRAGTTIIKAGSLLSACPFAGALTFLSSTTVDVFKKVRIGIINTGDELIEFGQPIESWQIRDSNGPFLESSLACHKWIQTERTSVSDQREQTEEAIREKLNLCDVILLTGGVSMGDTDYVPDSIRSMGGQVAFHRIPIRPGRPLLGAYGPAGQLILGLPGNPLSTAVTFRRYAMELIRHVAGFAHPIAVPLMLLETDEASTSDLTWFRLVSFQADGRLSLVSSQGSGDIASLTRSDGFVEIPPNCKAAGTRPFYAWGA